MNEVERYTALRSLYLHWHAQHGDTMHLDLAEYCTARIGEVLG